jgi:hypothetical protein
VYRTNENPHVAVAMAGNGNLTFNPKIEKTTEMKATEITNNLDNHFFRFLFM